MTRSEECHSGGPRFHGTAAELQGVPFLGTGVFRVEQPGRLTNIGPKMVAVTDAEGKVHWLKMAAFVELNRDNG